MTLDQVLCDPVRAREFDAIAASIAAGYSPFEYRWAALALRKTRQLKPELIAKIIGTVEVRRYAVASLDIGEIPNLQGAYLFHDSGKSLYVGEARSLYHRIKKHIDHSDNKGLARWLWEHGALDLHLEIHVLPNDTTTKTRKAFEAELILSRRPLFNIAGVDH